MKMPFIVLCSIICWIGLGLIGSGFNNAYFQRKWDNICDGRHDHAKAILTSIIGPFNISLSFLISGYSEYGWSLKINANPKCIK